MKKYILFGFLISIFLMIVTPNIPALQFSVVEDTLRKNSSDIFSLVENNANEPLNINDLKFPIFSLILTIYEDDDPIAEPLFLGVIYALLAVLIFSIVFFVIQHIGSIVATVLMTIVQIIQSFFSIISLGIQGLVTILVAFFTGFFNFILELAILFGNAVSFTISVIGSLITLFFQGILALIIGIWQGFGAFIGLILDIFRLIYEAVFPPNAIIT